MWFQISSEHTARTVANTTVRCGDTTFPKRAYIELPVQFHSLNDNTSVINANHIEVATQEQSSCELWHNLRYDRLTASNFGRVMSRKALPSDAFLKHLFCRPPHDINSASLNYGCRNESIAKEKYL